MYKIWNGKQIYNTDTHNNHWNTNSWLGDRHIKNVGVFSIFLQLAHAGNRETPRKGGKFGMHVHIWI